MDSFMRPGEVLSQYEPYCMQFHSLHCKQVAILAPQLSNKDAQYADTAEMVADD